jgi:hypothetical protein
MMLRFLSFKEGHKIVALDMASLREYYKAN